MRYVDGWITACFHSMWCMMYDRMLCMGDKLADEWSWYRLCIRMGKQKKGV